MRAQNSVRDFILSPNRSCKSFLFLNRNAVVIGNCYGAVEQCSMINEFRRVDLRTE